MIILAILILGSYYITGYVTEKKIKENLTIVNQSNGLNVNIENYNRGWFTSLAALNWNLHVPAHVVTNPSGQTQTIPAEDYQLKMPIKIYHGPIIFAEKTIKFGLGYAHSDVALPPKFVDQFNNMFTSESTKPKLDLSLLVTYLANTNVDLSVPEFKLISKNPNGGQLEWLGMTSSTTITTDRNKVSGNVTIEGARFTKEKTKASMSTITSEYNLHSSKNGMYLGDASMSFPSLDVSLNDKKILSMNQFDVHSDTNIEEGLFHSNLKTSLEKLVVNDKTYGPGNLEISIRNLDEEALNKINDQVNQMQQGSNELQRQQAILAILPQLPPLFSKGAEFEISELNLVMPEGKIEGNLLLAFPKSESANPFEMLQKIQGNGKLKVPAVVLKKVLIKSFQQKLAAGQQQPQPQNIQQGIIQQMQQQQATGQPVNSAQNPNAALVPNTAAPTDPAATPSPAPVDTTQQATAITESQLAALVQSGVLLVVQGDYYLIEMKLEQGKLLINGKPYDPAMLKLQ